MGKEESVVDRRTRNQIVPDGRTLSKGLTVASN